VHAIAQDADGSMWFGTEAGLAKFDGRRTQAVTDPELPGGRVLALQIDQDGVLWIGTDSGATRLANGKFEQIKDLAGKTVNAVITPEKGRAIVATEQGMVYDCRVKPQPPELPSATSVTRTVTSNEGSDGTISRAVPALQEVRPLLTEPLQSADADHPGPLALTSLTIAHDKLLVGSLSRGILLIENGAARPLEMRPQAYFVRALETDAKGQLWAGARSKKEESGFYEGDNSARIARVDAPTGPVTALRSGGRDDMWVGSDGRGVFHFAGPKDVVRFTFDGTLGGLRSDHVYAIFVDREEVVWFGTDRGVSRFDPHAPRVELVGDNPQSNFVRVLYQTADGQLLAGTNRRLFIHDKQSGTWRVMNSLSRNIIYALAEDKSGRLLVGSASGFYAGSARGHSDNEAFVHVEAASGEVDAPGNVRAIASFQGNTYIASYGRGLERIEGSRARLVWPTEADAAVEKDVVSLCADGDNRLLMGTIHGDVLVFDGHKTTTDPAFALLKNSGVRAIDRGNDGTLWFASGRGVYACKPGAACLLVAPGFEARNIAARRNGNAAEAWCATNGGGMIKILLDDKLGAIVSQLDAEQGLPSQNIFAVLPLHSDPGAEPGNDQLLIGTGRGLARYEPGTKAPSLLPTRIISKRVHQPEELRTGLLLEYPQNSLLLDVTAISTRTFPEQFQYAFVLTDSKGRSVKQRVTRDSQFTMEGLKPGKYKVTALAFTRDLVASSPLSFEVNVAGAPFPWTSTALAVLLTLALLALMWAVLEHGRIVRTSAALVAANRELAGARLDLANEAERERRRIARDLHDQTLADLRRLLLMTDRMPVGEAHSGGNAHSGSNERTAFDAALFRKEIESVSNEIRRICEDLSPSVLDNVGLAAALEWALSNAVAHLPAAKKFECEVVATEDIEEQIKLESGVRIQIYRIAQEVLNNICRHADAKHVRLTLDTSAEGDLVLRIEDDGSFFAPSDGHTEGRGLANIHARASLIEAKVSWTERPGGGTIFTLRKSITGPLTAAGS
jgi:signal transduction histidine kinase/ligand-binding sensor domain-containing protein